jgi:hypothetical protein
MRGFLGLKSADRRAMIRGIGLAARMVVTGSSGFKKLETTT